MGRIILGSLLVLVSAASASAALVDATVISDQVSRGVLTRTSDLTDSQDLTFRCSAPNGDAYLVSLDRSRNWMSVEHPGVFKAEGFPSVTTVFTDNSQHFHFTNGYNPYHYNFDLAVDRTNPSIAQFELVSAGGALSCSSSP